MVDVQIKRHVDKHGRVALPVELRRRLDISELDLIGMQLVDEQLILAKYRSACCLCESKSNLLSFKERQICQTCRRQIASLIAGNGTSTIQ